MKDEYIQFGTVMPACQTLTATNKKRFDAVLIITCAVDIFVYFLHYILLKWNRKLKSRGVEGLSLSQKYQVSAAYDYLYIDDNTEKYKKASSVGKNRSHLIASSSSCK